MAGCDLCNRPGYGRKAVSTTLLRLCQDCRSDHETVVFSNVGRFYGLLGLWALTVLMICITTLICVFA
jgi:hypothetical protein